MPTQLRLLIVQKGGSQIDEHRVSREVVTAENLDPMRDIDGVEYYRKARSDGFVFDLKYRHDFLYVQTNDAAIESQICMQMFLAAPELIGLGILRLVDGVPGRRNYFVFVE